MRFVPIVVLAWLVVLLAYAVSVATRGGVRHGDARRYKPRSTHRPAGTRFDDAPATEDDRRPDADAPTDFVTGAPLDPDEEIVRCDDCRALYHPDTVATLAAYTGGNCASCGGTALRPLARHWRRRDADAHAHALVVEPATPEAFEAALGRLVTVDAEVVGALPAPPTAVPSLLVRAAGGVELRLAFVGDAVRGRRGRAFVLGLLGARLRARGLLLRDEAHGLRLLAIDPAMVREVDR